MKISKKSKDIKVNLIIPHRGKSKFYKNGSLLQNCIEHAKLNKLLNNIYVFVDNKKVFKSIPKEKKFILSLDLRSFLRIILTY